MLDDVLALLSCPHCGAALTRSGASVVCPARHSYDLARQGYLNLLPGDAQLGTADSAAMVGARADLLAGGHFDPLAGALASAAAEALADGPEGAVVDLGAGTGWYLARVLDRVPGRVGLALDLSKHALRRAARAHERAGAVAADAWRSLPLRDGVAALALNVFAPRGGAEIARILAPGGALAVVTPTTRHLAELVGPLGLIGVDERKQERLAQALGPHLALGARSDCEWDLALDRAAARAAVEMGPSASHVDRGTLEGALATLPEPLGVTGSVVISVYRRVP